MAQKHITTQGDTWDAISLRYYNDEKYLDKIIQANHEYRDMVVFPANVILNIPDVGPLQTLNLPVWRRFYGG